VAIECWPLKRYGSLAAKILEEFGLQTVINVGPGEADLSTAVIRAAVNAQPFAFHRGPGATDGTLKNATAVVAEIQDRCILLMRLAHRLLRSLVLPIRRATDLQAIGSGAALGRCSDNI